MTIYDKMNVTRDLMFTLSAMIDDVEFAIKMIEDKKERTEADEKLLNFAKHLKRIYCPENKEEK